MSFFERHPRATISFFLLFLIILVMGMMEIVLRFTIPYDIGYYTAVQKPGVYEYPYGTIRMNSAGYPDEEFDLNSSKKRIGYFGDSVIYGVGAGDGYRFSDILEKRYPKYDHWTFSMIANGIQDNEVADKAKEYGLNTVIYAFNLNDILPAPKLDDAKGSAAGETVDKTPFIRSLEIWVWNNLDGLRGKSYLYTWLRTLVKNALQQMGYSHTGFKAAELFPDDNRELIHETAARVNDIAKALKKQGVMFCVVLLPYEMQISKDARKTYSDFGIRWQKEFEDGLTQTYLRQDFDFPHVYDGRKAFTDAINTARTGEFFVYNKGDKIDFNHPNREGHRRLADGFAQSHTCPVFRN